MQTKFKGVQLHSRQKRIWKTKRVTSGPNSLAISTRMGPTPVVVCDSQPACTHRRSGLISWWRLGALWSLHNFSMQANHLMHATHARLHSWAIQKGVQELMQSMESIMQITMRQLKLVGPLPLQPKRMGHREFSRNAIHLNAIIQCNCGPIKFKGNAHALTF